MKKIMEKLISMLILFISFTAISMDNGEDFETLQEPDCKPLEVLVELPIPVKAGYTFGATHALVKRCMGVNDEKKVCVYTKTKMERWKIVMVQKETKNKDYLYVSWVSHENCTYHRGRNCSLEDAIECRRNGTTHYYDEIKCTCTHAVCIHEDIASVPTAEVETVVSLTPTLEGTIISGTLPAGADNNDVSRFTTPMPMENSQMSMPLFNMKDNHSEILNITNYTSVGDVGTSINNSNDVNSSSIVTNDTHFNMFGTNDQLYSVLTNDTIISIIMKNKNLICISSIQYKALVVVVVLILVFLLVLSLYFFFMKNRYETQYQI